MENFPLSNLWPSSESSDTFYICNKLKEHTHHDIKIIVKLWSRSKVYLKSQRDLDPELDSTIAMSPQPENFSEQNNIEISSCMNWLVIWDPSGGVRRWSSWEDWEEGGMRLEGENVEGRRRSQDQYKGQRSISNLIVKCHNSPPPPSIPKEVSRRQR